MQSMLRTACSITPVVEIAYLISIDATEAGRSVRDGGVIGIVPGAVPVGVNFKHDTCAGIREPNVRIGSEVHAGGVNNHAAIVINKV
jgi:hypothetical protein